MNNHNIKTNSAMKILQNEYAALRHITDFKTRVNQAKKQAIKTILNNCICYACQDACYLIETSKFY